MSRVGKMPVMLPKGVKASMDGRTVRLEGPLGTLSFEPGQGVSVNIEEGRVLVTCPCENRQQKADFGTARAIIGNMAKGVSSGWKRAVELNGVGFNARTQGSKLVLSVGFSHDVEIEIPNGVKCAVNKNVIEFESADRNLLGAFAARIRKTQPAEPYLGKGIKYTDETIRRKAGKAASAKKG